MKTQNFSPFVRNSKIPIEKLLATLIAFFALSVKLSDSQIIMKTTMFEIPNTEDQKRYILRDCRKMAAGDIDCKCTYLGRECQEADTRRCENCSCLNGSTKIFYIKKRYGALCLSVNNLFYAAGFSKKFQIHNPIVSQCVLASDTDILPMKCTLNNPRQVWLWTPGNLLMNAQTSTCLETRNRNSDYLPMRTTRCDSSELEQKWRCEERQSSHLFGLSFSNYSNITHAMRYLRSKPTLLAKSVKKLSIRGNSWTIFPTNNQSVCSARDKEGFLYLDDDENTEISQMDPVVECPHYICSKKLSTSTTTSNLSNCTILWEESFSQEIEPFMVENQEDGLYFKWKSNPYSRLKGTTLELTIECLMNNRNLKEFLFRLRVKDVNFIAVREYRDYNIGNVDLGRHCTRNTCLKNISVPLTLNKTNTACYIEWRTSRAIKTDENTTIVTENVTDLLSLKKIARKHFLQWNLTAAPLLADIKFNLTILCYDDENKNTTTVEKLFLVFQTRYRSTTTKSSQDNRLYLPIILPIIILLLIILAIVLVFCVYRRKQRKLKESTSTQSLHSKIVNQNSNVSFQLNHIGVENKSEDNPVYEQCTSAAHPAVTIARNQLYECTKKQGIRVDSDIYEQPLESLKVRQNELYVSVDPTNLSGNTKSHPASKTSPKSNLYLAPKPGINLNPVSKAAAPQHYKIPKVIQPPEEEQDIYDQPLGYIPSLKNDNAADKVGKNEIPLQDVGDQRIHSTYEKPLPDSPPSSGIYEYASRDELTFQAYQPEKTSQSRKERESNGSVNSNGSLCDAPHYDVLERI